MKIRGVFQSKAWWIVRFALLAVIFVCTVVVIARASSGAANLAWKYLEPRAPSLTKSDTAAVTPPEPLSLVDTALMTEIREYRGVVARTLTIRMEDGRTTAKYELDVPSDHPMIKALRIQGRYNKPDLFVSLLLGAVKVGMDRLQFTFLGSSIDASEPSRMLHIWLTSSAATPRVSSRVEIEAASLPYMRFDPDRVDFRHPESRQVSLDVGHPIIETRSETQIVLTRPRPPESSDPSGWPPVVEGLGFRIEPVTSELGEFPRPTLIAVLRWMELNPPVLGSLLFSMLASLPFLLFLYYVRKHGSSLNESLSVYSLVVVLFISFHFGVYGFESIRQLLVWLAPHLPLRLGVVGDVMWPAALLLVAYVWPAVSGQTLSDGAIPRATIQSGVFTSAVILTSGTAAVVLLERSTELPAERRFLGLAILGLVLSIWLAWKLLPSLFPLKRTAGKSLLVCLSLMLLPLLTPWVTGDQLHQPFDRGQFYFLLPGIAILAAASLLLVSFFNLGCKIFGRASIRQQWTGWPFWRRAATVLGILFLAYPTGWVVGDAVILPVWTDILGVAYSLDDLLVFLFLCVLLLILKRESESQPDVIPTPLACRIGIVLALTFFFNPTLRWMYIPVVFLLGYVVTSRWLLHEMLDLRTVAGELIAKRSQVIQSSVALEYLEKALYRLRRSVVKNAEDSKFDLQAHEKKIEALAASIHSAESAYPLRINNIDTRDLALAVGPSASAWSNGKICAWYGLLFALPWLALYFRNLASSQELNPHFLLLDLVSKSAGSIAVWALYGFFFGYFFPIIRGRNGLEKAFNYFLTLAIPHVVITIIFVPLGLRDWPSFGVWLMQVFIHTMLLGLIAGDYESLRRSGLGWFQLVEVHDLTTLATWASTTGLAIVGAIAALLGTNSIELVKAAFQLMAGPKPGP